MTEIVFPQEFACFLFEISDAVVGLVAAEVMFQAAILCFLIIKLRGISRQKEWRKHRMLHMETQSALAVMRLGIILHLNYLLDAMARHERQNMLLMLLVLFASASLERSIVILDPEFFGNALSNFWSKVTNSCNFYVFQFFRTGKCQC